MSAEADKPADEGHVRWYAAGLAFECQRSGNCCGGAPGHVWVKAEERQAITVFLGLPPGRPDKRYFRRVGLRWSLTERPGGDCVFLERGTGPDHCGTGCRINSVKPIQCRTWPFWSSNLKSPRAWSEAGGKCPGINRGKLHCFTDIEQLRRKRSL